MNYEDEISDTLALKIQNIYGIDPAMAYRYMVLRYLISMYKKALDVFLFHRKIAEYIIEELGIELFDGSYVLYRGERVPICYGTGHSVENIVLDWEFRALMEAITDMQGNKTPLSEYIKKTWKLLKKNAENKAKKYKNSIEYEEYVKYYGIMALNELYGIEGLNEIEDDGLFKYRDNGENKRFEIKLQEHLKDKNKVSYNVKSISESELERYVMHNLNEIEKGLQFVAKQVSIKSGRIDILARDKLGQYVIVELKVAEDKELIWQSLYYPLQLCKELKLNNVRMITLAPDYPAHILEPLKLLNNVEIIKYIPIIQTGELTGLKIRPL